MSSLGDFGQVAPYLASGYARGRARAEDYRFRSTQQQLRNEALSKQNAIQMQRLLVDLENARRRGLQEDEDRKARRVSELSDIILKDPGAFSAMPEESQERVLLEFADLKGYTPYGTLVPAGKRRETVPREGIHAAMRPTETTMTRTVDDPTAPARVLDIPAIPLSPSDQALIDWRRSQGQNLTWQQGFKQRQLEELTTYHKGLLANVARTNDIRAAESEWRAQVARLAQASNTLRTQAYVALTQAQARRIDDQLINTIGRLPAQMRDRIEYLTKIGMQKETLPSGRVRFSTDPIAVRAREELAEILGLNAQAMMDAATAPPPAGGPSPADPRGGGFQVPSFSFPQFDLFGGGGGNPFSGPGAGAPYNPNAAVPFPGPSFSPFGSAPFSSPGGAPPQVLPDPTPRRAPGAQGAPVGVPPALPPVGGGRPSSGGTQVRPPRARGGRAPSGPPSSTPLGPGWQPRKNQRPVEGRVPAPDTRPSPPPGPPRYLGKPASASDRDVEYVEWMIDQELYEGVAKANPENTEGGRRLREIYRYLKGRKKR